MRNQGKYAARWADRFNITSLSSYVCVVPQQSAILISVSSQNQKYRSSRILHGPFHCTGRGKLPSAPHKDLFTFTWSTVDRDERGEAAPILCRGYHGSSQWPAPLTLPDTVADNSTPARLPHTLPTAPLAHLRPAHTPKGQQHPSRTPV